MDDYVLWVIAAGVLAVGEIATTAFLLGPIAIAAALTAVLALVGAPMALQLLVFAASSAASLLFLRPIAQRHLYAAPAIRTGTARLIGEPAKTLTAVEADGGQIKLAGEVWTARPLDDDEVIEEGVRVDVVQIQGATAVVVRSD
jgi:membrane protein implicated in regulation of membrane protease activity